MTTRLFAAGIVALVAASATINMAQATDPALPRPASPPVWQADIGARYWYSSGTSAVDLYGIDRGAMVSRLTYADAKGHAAEAFGRFDHLGTNLFVKGYAGLGTMSGGTLNDEDFPPLTMPYSSTMSDLKNNKLSYASVDIGYDVLRSANARVGGFVGYHYFNEQLNAMGCRQIATSPTICNPGFPTSVSIISQDSTWHSLRLGVAGQFALNERVKLTADAAWVPYTWFDGTDTHWLRIGGNVGDFTGPVPDSGSGSGYQLEAVMSYLVTDALSVGVGGRYWYMKSDSTTHFDGHVVGGGSPQPADWSTRRYGVFVQASYKFESGIVGR